MRNRAKVYRINKLYCHALRIKDLDSMSWQVVRLTHSSSKSLYMIDDDGIIHRKKRRIRNFVQLMLVLCFGVIAVPSCPKRAHF